MSKTNKFILWCGLVAVTSFWMWAGVQAWLRGSLFEVDPSILGILSGLFILLLVLLSLGFVFFEHGLKSIYLGLIVGIMFLILFGVSNLNLVGVFILVMLFNQAQDIVHGEIRERIKMNPRILIRKSLTNLVLGLFILVSFAAYSSPAIESFKNITELPSASTVFINTIVEQTLGGQLAGASPDQKELVLNQVTKEVVEQANSFLEPYFDYAPPALAFGLFLVLWGVGWIFIWLAVLLGMFLFWMLKKIKFFAIIEKDVKAETLTI